MSEAKKSEAPHPVTAQILDAIEPASGPEPWCITTDLLQYAAKLSAIEDPDEMASVAMDIVCLAHRLETRERSPQAAAKLLSFLETGAPNIIQTLGTASYLERTGSGSGEMAGSHEDVLKPKHKSGVGLRRKW